MPEYLAPGVYVEETDTGTKPIEGVSTSTCGMVGVTERGPVNVPILITSTGEFRRWFGELLDLTEFSNPAGPLCYLPNAIEGFFTNGGQRVYVTRIEHANSTHAEITLRDRGPAVAFDTRLLRASERATGTVLSRPFVSVIDMAGIGVGETLRIGAGSDAEYHEVASTAPSRHVPLVTGLDGTHAAGTAIRDFERVLDAAFSSFTVDLDVDAGGTRLDLTETVAGEAAALAGAGAGVLLEFGVAPHATYRFVELAQTRSATQVRVELTAPLAVDVAAGDAVNVVQAAGDADIPGVAGFTLAVDPTGLVNFDVTETAAGDATAALAVVGTFVIEFGGTGERVPVLAMAASGAAAITITIAAPVVGAYAIGDPVTLRTTNITALATLESMAAPDDAALFADDLDGAFSDDTHLVVVAPGTAGQEVRRIGGLVELELEVGAYEDYDGGSTARAVVLADDDRSFAGVAAGIDTLVAVGDVSTILPGQTLLVGPGSASEETAVVAAVDTGTSTITLTAGLANAHNAVGTDFFAVQRATTAGVDAGAGVLSLDSRLGLAAGDVLRVGDAPDDEFAVIDDLLGDEGDTPDPGSVVFTAPLRRDHAAGSAVRRTEVSAPGAGSHDVALVLATTEDDQAVFLAEDDGFAAGGFLALTSAAGLVHYHQISNAAAAVVPTEVELVAPLQFNQAAGSDFVQRNALLELHAIDSGGWGNRLRASILDEGQGLVEGATITALAGLAVITVSSLVGFEPGTVLEMIDPADESVVGAPLKVQAVNRSNGQVTLGTPLSGPQAAVALASRLRSREFNLTIALLPRPDPVNPTRNDEALAVEVFDHLSMDPRHSRYVRSVLGNVDVEAGDRNLRLSDRRTEGGSWYVRVRDLAANAADATGVRLGPEPLVDVLPDGTEAAARRRFTQGDDAVALIADADYVGQDAADPLNRTGLHALRGQDDVSILAAPGRTGSTVQSALIAQCEILRYRFAVLDGPASPSDSLADVRNQRQQFDTKYAALYHPWLQVPHPFPPVPSPEVIRYQVPPSGHVCGIYARTDIQRGVHKSPANEVVRGILGLQQTLRKREQDVLNPFPSNINVIRDFRRENRGIRVYGGRVITSDSDWKYVNVRRLVIYIEASLDRGLQWVVFEPNAEPLWARVVRTISNFLTVVWRNGALEGTSPQEAYFVRCDRTTMTQADIDNGRLICVIGVAPVKPAEFVIIRIGLWTAHADN